jgi:starch synthase (maltosyl-transferring)
MEIALDLAYQAAPDHPYVKDHPLWFKWRSDGTVKYAENPPKKYQDILPIYFESQEWESLWDELLDVILYWVKCGVKIFRVDNPHTKAIPFWEWAIAETHRQHPEVIFLAEAFTKPKLMHALAKVGFTQGYTYYTWRNFRHELNEYLTELTQETGVEYFRPNFWPNTPDILPYNLQSGNEALYLIRLFMAGTLSSNYGVYGPVYEQMVHEAVPGKEEYYHSEKYELKHWDWQKDTKITWLMRLLNNSRKNNLALQQTRNYRFLPVENESIYAYFKWEGDNHLLMVVNLDPYQVQEGWVQWPNNKLPLRAGGYQLEDLASGAAYNWQEEWNYVKLDPALPFHLFKVHQ